MATGTLGRPEFRPSFFQITLLILFWAPLVISKPKYSLVRAAFEECGALRNNTAIEIKSGGQEMPQLLEYKLPAPSVNVCYPMNGLEELTHKKHVEKLTHMAHLPKLHDNNKGLLSLHSNNQQSIKYGLVLNIDSCERQLADYYSSGVGQMITRKPFMMIRQNTSLPQCKCENLIVTSDVHFQVDSTVWAVNGILLQNPNFFCLHHGATSLTRNKVHVYTVNGIYKNTQICEGNPVKHVTIHDVWTKRTHPCGKKEHQASSRSPGSSICVMKKSATPQVFNGRLCSHGKVKTEPKLKPYLHSPPPSCGPVRTELDPGMCHVRCHRDGLIAIPGSCHMFGRCHFARRQFGGYFTLYLLSCPPYQRFDGKKGTCVPGICVAQNKHRRFLNVWNH